MKRLLFLLPILFLVSCAHYPDGTSVWSEGLWILPVLIAIGFFLSAYRAWVAYNSGTVEGGGGGKPYKDLGKGKPPMKNNGWLWFSIFLFVAFWVVIYVVNNGK